MISTDVLAWLQQSEDKILNIWLATVQNQNLALDRSPEELQKDIDPLYRAVINAVECQKVTNTADLTEWTRRHRQERSTPLPVLLRVAFALRAAVMAVLLESGETEQAIEAWRTLASGFDQVTELVSEIYTQTMEQALTERLDEADYLTTSLVQATEEADRALVQLRSIYNISQILSTALNNVEDIFDKLVQRLGTALQAQHCALWLTDVGALRVAAMHSENEILTTTISEEEEQGALSTVLLSGKSQRLRQSPSTPPSDKRLMTSLHAHSLLLVPLVVQEIPIGVVTLGRKDGVRAFDSTEVTLVESVISQAAIAMQNAGLYEEIRSLNRSLEGRVAARTRELAREKERLEALYAIGRELSTSLDLNQVLEKTLQLVTQAIGAKRSTIMLLDPETDFLVYHVRLGETDPSPSDREVTPFKPGVGVAGWVLKNRQPAWIDDVLKDERWMPINGKTPSTRSLIAAPLLVGDDIHGVISISDDTPNAFDESQLKLVIASAQQVAQAISNAQLYNYVRSSAERLGELFRREQEERSKSQAVLQSIADGVIVNDVQDQVIIFNTAAEEILDIKGEAVLGQDVWRLFDVFEEEGRSDALAAMEAISASPTASAGQVIETTLEFKNKVISAHMAPVITENHESLGVVTALRDITREVEADRAKSEFVSTVSHELRTPLTSIKGYADLLHAGAVGAINDHQKRFLGIIKNNADRLTALINDLLDISRIATGRVKLKIEPINLVDIIHEVVDSLREQIEGQGLKLEMDLPDDVGEIMGDRIRVTQIVTNLFSNAYKYTDEGWIRMTLSLLGEAVRLDVIDSGIGISAEDQSKIFERFYRADTPVMDGRGGTGLGLAITKDLIELHGGRIWVKSELGVGSTFTVVLPAAARELPSSIMAELPAGAKKILVVDDERDILALLRHQLGMQSYQVVTASTGGQAITKAIEEQPDLITLDILLPDRHGFDVLRELKARPETAHIPVIVLSVVQDETSGYKLGAVDYIVKPLDEKRLLNSVSHILNPKDKILIAEDTPDTAELLIELLKKQGYEPLHAMDGYETLALARREHPGLILLDLQMPGMDGYEALTRLKKDPETRKIPILVMSAHAADAVQERLRVQEMGAEDFLSKPFSLEELMQEIEKVIFDENRPQELASTLENDTGNAGSTGAE